MGRRWHFFFAWLLVINGAAYLLYGLLSRHFSRDLAPSRRDWAHIPRSIWDHMRLRFPEGEKARRYNVLQKLAYIAVIFVVLPVIVLTGLTMSPAFNAGFPWMLSLFGGRQSARTIHFIAASGLVLFVVVHIVEALLSGAVNNIRSMFTGRYVIKKDPDAHPAPARP